jgi:voltage-gated potassium channel
MDRVRRTEQLDRVERATELSMLGLAVVILVVIAIPELTRLSPSAQYILEGVGWIVWAVFALELVVKTYLAPNRRRYLVTHWPDVLVVTLPFLRPPRLLRVVVVASRF